MKTVKSLLVLSLLLFTQIVFSQVTFSHAAGASFYVGGQASAPGIMYSPRVNILEISDALSFSLGTHLGLGLTFNSQEGASSFALDIPLVAELNFGSKATPENEESFGGFVGAGYGISKIGSAGAFGADSNDASGPVFNAGIRTVIANIPVGLRASFLLNLKSGYKSVFGIGAFYTFR